MSNVEAEKYDAFLEFTLREQLKIMEDLRDSSISWAKTHLEDAGEAIESGANPSQQLTNAAQGATTAAAAAGVAYGLATALRLVKGRPR